MLKIAMSPTIVMGDLQALAAVYPGKASSHLERLVRFSSVEDISSPEAKMFFKATACSGRISLSATLKCDVVGDAETFHIDSELLLKIAKSASVGGVLEIIHDGGDITVRTSSSEIKLNDTGKSTIVMDIIKPGKYDEAYLPVGFIQRNISRAKKYAQKRAPEEVGDILYSGVLFIADSETQEYRIIGTDKKVCTILAEKVQDGERIDSTFTVTIPSDVTTILESIDTGADRLLVRVGKSVGVVLSDRHEIAFTMPVGEYVRADKFLPDVESKVPYVLNNSNFVHSISECKPFLTKDTKRVLVVGTEDSIMFHIVSRGDGREITSTCPAKQYPGEGFLCHVNGDRLTSLAGDMDMEDLMLYYSTTGMTAFVATHEVSLDKKSWRKTYLATLYDSGKVEESDETGNQD